MSGTFHPVSMSDSTALWPVVNGSCVHGWPKVIDSTCGMLVRKFVVLGSWYQDFSGYTNIVVLVRKLPRKIPSAKKKSTPAAIALNKTDVHFAFITVYYYFPDVIFIEKLLATTCKFLNKCRLHVHFTEHRTCVVQLQKTATHLKI